MNDSDRAAVMQVLIKFHTDASKEGTIGHGIACIDTAIDALEQVIQSGREDGALDRAADGVMRPTSTSDDDPGGDMIDNAIAAITAGIRSSGDGSLNASQAIALAQVYATIALADRMGRVDEVVEMLDQIDSTIRIVAK